MLFCKLLVSVQVSLQYKNIDSTNASKVRNFKNLERDGCQILFSFLEDFHARVFLTFTLFSVLSIHAPKYLKLSTL